MIALSQSALTTFHDCPKAYEFYKDRVQGMFWDFDPLDIGKYVHKALEDYYKKSFLTKGDADDIVIESYHWLKKTWDVTFPPEYLKKAYTCLENHAQWESNNINNGMNTEPLVEVEITKNGYHGIIDYVDLVKDKVIDWKTNTWPTLSYTYRMQASVYKELYDAKFNRDLTHFYFFFLYSNTWRTVKYNTEKQKEVAEYVRKLKDEVKDCYQDEEFPRKPRTDKMCENCLYKWYCRREDG